MIENKELRDKILVVLDENEGDIHLQADALMKLLVEENLLLEDEEDYGCFLDGGEESEESDEW